MTIGIAIPTYLGHIHFIDRLLDSISESTILPDEVSISASNITSINHKKYDFKIIKSTSENYQNASQNRNIAASLLSTDIISFIDGDDMIHPQRNEFLLKVFENKTIMSVVHNFLETQVIDYNFLKNRYNDIELYIDYIDTIFSNSHYPSNAILHKDFGNGAVSVRKEIFDIFKYNEDESVVGIEDSLYNKQIVASGYKISLISNKLSLYLKNPNRR